MDDVAAAAEVKGPAFQLPVGVRVGGRRRGEGQALGGHGSFESEKTWISFGGGDDGRFADVAPNGHVLRFRLVMAKAKGCVVCMSLSQHSTRIKN